MVAKKATTQYELQQQRLSDEAIRLVIKRSGVSRAKLHEAAEKRFFVDNIDLLTPAERKKFSSVIL